MVKRFDRIAGLGDEAQAHERRQRDMEAAQERRKTEVEAGRLVPQLFRGEARWTNEGNGKDVGVCKKESHFEMPFGLSVHVRCDSGGPNSKYEKNEDGYLVVETNNGQGFLVFVVDGAGGSGAGMRARDIAVQEAVEVASRHYGTDGFELTEVFDRINERFVRGDTSKDGFATGVGLHVKHTGKGVYTIEVINRGDCQLVPVSKDPRKPAPDLKTQVHNIAFASVGDSKEYYTHPQMNEITSDLAAHDPLTDRKVVRYDSNKDPEGFFCVMASDGFFDRVSPYEAQIIVQELFRQGKTGEEIEKQLFALAYERNNARDTFRIAVAPPEGEKFDLERDQVKITPDAYRRDGDNITIALVDLKLPRDVVHQKKESDGSENGEVVSEASESDLSKQDLERRQKWAQKALDGKEFTSLKELSKFLINDRSRGLGFDFPFATRRVSEVGSKNPTWSMQVEVNIQGKMFTVELSGEVVGNINEISLMECAELGSYRPDRDDH